MNCRPFATVRAGIENFRKSDSKMKAGPLGTDHVMVINHARLWAADLQRSVNQKIEQL
jgi:hypothetical protein